MASAKESRTGADDCAGAWARKAAALTSARTSTISGRDAMEKEIDVSVEIAGDVEALRHAMRERFARDNGVEQRRHGELGRDGEVHLLELARLDTPRQHAFHETVTARDYFVVIEASQFGEVARLSNHESRNTREGRLAHEPPVLANQPLEQIARAARKCLRDRLPFRDDWNDGLANQRLEQRFLVLEVQ